MKPEQIFEELKDLAEKLGVSVSEQSFRTTGIPVQSGFCLIKGEMHCIIDRNISLTKKCQVLAKSLAHLPHENLYVVPTVRDLIGRYGKRDPMETSGDASGGGPDMARPDS